MFICLYKTLVLPIYLSMVTLFGDLTIIPIRSEKIEATKLITSLSDMDYANRLISIFFTLLMLL